MSRCRLLAATLAVVLCHATLASPADDLVADARRAMELGDTAQAFRSATQAIEAGSKEPDAYAIRAAVYDQTAEFEKAAAEYSRIIALWPQSVGAFERRGEDQFRLGHFKESVADFDQVLKLQPDKAPYHWQRGISLYYAGKFEAGAKQFELHKTVNPEDVENAVWHYLCVAKVSGVEKARQGLIPIHDDGRVPMMQVYAMFSGTLTPDDVLRTASAGGHPAAELARRQFYAHLYIGLYFDAAGNSEEARKYIQLAAEKADDAGYMGDVARAHAALLKKAAK